MTAMSYTVLEERGVIDVTGEDRVAFLQGLVSNDVARAGPGRALWSAFLTPQGKYLYDFFLAEREGAFLLDCEGGERLAGFLKRLSMYKLRSKVELADRSAGTAVLALWGDEAPAVLGLPAERGIAAPCAGGVVFVDPRLPEAGLRLLAPRPAAIEFAESAGFSAASFADWDAHRLALGLPDGSRDLPVERALLLENGFDELDGVSFSKGCYMGQELTARTKHRGLIRKRLMPVAIDGPTPAPGTPILRDGEDAGEMRTARYNFGLALIRLEGMEGTNAMTCGGARLTPRRPGWMKV
ncbi:MAG: folate-binding protein [Magnetospirillum sp. WYHS-4]